MLIPLAYIVGTLIDAARYTAFLYPREWQVDLRLLIQPSRKAVAERLAHLDGEITMLRCDERNGRLQPGVLERATDFRRALTELAQAQNRWRSKEEREEALQRWLDYWNQK